jgi:glycosyltransferase involved in cell wall biosynthesis
VSAKQSGDRRIAFVTSSPAVHHPRHYHLLARSLVRAGLPVVVAGQPDRRPNPKGEVPVWFLPRREGRLARMASGPEFMWRVARSRPALIQVNSLDLLPWAVVARKLFRVPIVYDSNDDYEFKILYKDWLPRPLRRPLSRLVAKLEPWLGERLDATLVATTETAVRFEGNRSPVLTLHNFPWRDYGDGAAASEPRYDVTYHGTLSNSYLEQFIPIALELKARGVELRWCLAANDFRPAEQAALEARLRAAELREDFTLFYNLPSAEIPALLAQTRFGLIPLPGGPEVQRSLPMKLFEFLATGRPAVVSDLPAVRRLVDGAGCCVLVRPGDILGFADAVERLLRDPALAAEMGDRGRRLVRERLHAERELQPYVDLCRGLLGDDGRR